MTKARRMLRALPRFAVFACAAVLLIAWIASFAFPTIVTFKVDLETGHDVTLFLDGQNVFFSDKGSTSQKKFQAPRAFSIEQKQRLASFANAIRSIRWAPRSETIVLVADGPSGRSLIRLTYGNLPLWIPTLLLAIPIAFMVYSRRTKPGECPHCRYDKQGLPSAVCPECGKALAPNP